MITQVEPEGVSNPLPSVFCAPCSALKYQRLLRGWSQQDVVNALSRLCQADGQGGVGLDRRMVCLWEKGRHLPSPIYRKQLCVLYGLTAAELGFLEGQVQP